MDMKPNAASRDMMRRFIAGAVAALNVGVAAPAIAAEAKPPPAPLIVELDSASLYPKLNSFIGGVGKTKNAHDIEEDLRESKAAGGHKEQEVRQILEEAVAAEPLPEARRAAEKIIAHTDLWGLANLINSTAGSNSLNLIDKGFLASITGEKSKVCFVFIDRDLTDFASVLDTFPNLSADDRKNLVDFARRHERRHCDQSIGESYAAESDADLAAAAAWKTQPDLIQFIADTHMIMTVSDYAREWQTDSDHLTAFDIGNYLAAVEPGHEKIGMTSADVKKAYTGFGYALAILDGDDDFLKFDAQISEQGDPSQYTSYVKTIWGLVHGSFKNDEQGKPDPNIEIVARNYVDSFKRLAHRTADENALDLIAQVDAAVAQPAPTIPRVAPVASPFTP